MREHPRRATLISVRARASVLKLITDYLLKNAMIKTSQGSDEMVREMVINSPSVPLKKKVSVTVSLLIWLDFEV